MCSKGTMIALAVAASLCSSCVSHFSVARNRADGMPQEFKSLIARLSVDLTDAEGTIVEVLAVAEGGSGVLTVDMAKDVDLQHNSGSPVRAKIMHRGRAADV